MTDQPHDETILPDDLDEDLSPEADADEVSGGSPFDYFLKLDGIKGEPTDG